MDLEEQNKLAEELERVLVKRLKDEPFHFSLAVAKRSGGGFAFSTTSLIEKDSFENCKLVVRGIIDEANYLIDKFEFPSNKSLKKPVELK